MSTIDLEAAERVLFPSSGKSALSAALGVDPSTLWRYAQRGKIPGPVQAAVAAWLVLKQEFDLDPPTEPCSTRDIEELAEMADRGIRKRSGLLGIEAAASVVFGEAGWKTKLSSSLGVDYSTVWRQIVNDNVQGPVMAAIRAWLVLKLLGAEPPIPAVKPEKKTKRPMSNYARLMLEDEDE